MDDASELARDIGELRRMVRRARLRNAAVFAAILALMAARFDGHRLLMRRIILARGLPGKGHISRKMVFSRSYPTDYFVEINYARKSGDAPREMVLTSREGYDALPVGREVAVHYLPGLDSWVALDDDFGVERQRGGLIALLLAPLLCWWTYTQFFKRYDPEPDLVQPGGPS